jgi:uncharacterized protein (TIGR00303 family)
MIKAYTQKMQAERWLRRYKGCKPMFACVLGFTETALIPGISAAGATPESRQFTALADAEFLYNGPQQQPQYPLPPLDAGASPVLISRAVIELLDIPVSVFNAGLKLTPSVPHIDLNGVAARCVSSGCAMDRTTVNHLFQQGLHWGEKLAATQANSYLILSECVVGGTTTALAVLLGLGIDAGGKVNSSHANCNHPQKLAIATEGLQKAGLWHQNSGIIDPFDVVAAVGDPMQIVVAGMTLAASQTVGVLLAGGTQMLAVYRLTEAIAASQRLKWQPKNVVVGTTRWVAEDSSGDTVGLASLIGSVPILATQLNFINAPYPQLQAYERGFVKEGVGAGGCAIAAHLYQGWESTQLLQAIVALAERYLRLTNSKPTEQDPLI